MSDAELLAQDLKTYGVCFEQDGRRIDPRHLLVFDPPPPGEKGPMFKPALEALERLKQR